jgi:hypothetical protein
MTTTTPADHSSANFAGRADETASSTTRKGMNISWVDTINHVSRTCALLCSLIFLALLSGCGGNSNSVTTPPPVTYNAAGSWNLLLTDNAPGTVVYGMGIKIAGTSSLTGQAITYTGTTGGGVSCFDNYDITAVGSQTNQNVSLTITDPSTGGQILVTAAVNSGSSQMQGTFTFPFVGEGDLRYCGGDSGTAALTRQ